ncbi:MAG: sulfatase-like hydrolase/transferase [Solirubrobacterales bacterium]|nr:sulfatase-like hydrolase/transferase [Solirubrobacterales bacterium]
MVIQTDDQNAATVRARLRGEVGGLKPVMPHAVRQILNRGTEFRNYYASSPVCSPSRASLLSGQYPWNSGVEANLGPDGGWTGWQNHPIYRQNLPVTLNRHGYRTAHFGKFTNSYYDEENDRVDRTVPPGWDRWFTTAYKPGTRFYGYELNIDGRAVGPVGDPDYRQGGPGIDPATCGAGQIDQAWPAGPCRYLGDVMTAGAVREIERSEGRRQPFFIQVDYQAPHGDVAAPRGPQPATRHLGSASRTRLPRPPAFNEADFTDKPELIRSLAPDPMGAGEIRRLKRSYRRYLESLRSVDDGIGAIFRALRQSGELRRTYVFLLSDHGMFLGEHRYDWGKFMPYEDSSSPLMAVRGPGVRRGRVSREVVGNIDVPVTIMRLARSRPDYLVDGRSLKPFWRHPARRSSRPMAITINSQQDGEGASASAHAPALRYRGFRLGRYKYIRYDQGGEELYDLATDPDELENRAGSPRYAEALSFMREQLDQVTACKGVACREQLPVPPR